MPLLDTTRCARKGVFGCLMDSSLLIFDRYRVVCDPHPLNFPCFNNNRTHGHTNLGFVGVIPD